MNAEKSPAENNNFSWLSSSRIAHVAGIEEVERARRRRRRKEAQRARGEKENNKK
jgi:hypothetical protein